MAAPRAPLPLIRFVAVAGLLGLAACSPSGQRDIGPATEAAAPTPAPQGHPAVAATHWRCGGLAVVTHFDDASLESITLQTPERTLTLKSMANEDGARFADAAGNEFWSRPGKVQLTQIGQATVTCTKERG
jgi:hypothetical protein